jgi:hypothetical protein
MLETEFEVLCDGRGDAVCVAEGGEDFGANQDEVSLDEIQEAHRTYAANAGMGSIVIEVGGAKGARF